ncbi:MAG TPA: thioredoxin family protein [Opitutaceae bacterium]|jgi:thiol:disulfide interchange protein
MSSFLRRTCLGIALALAAWPALGSAAEYPAKGPDIYDVRADGSTQVDSAVASATLGNKRILLVFGANWCIWCRRLHAVFEKDPAVSKSLRDFVVVEIDVNKRAGVNRNAAVVSKYGVPIDAGIPAVAVLDSSGRLLNLKDTGELEDGDGYSRAKILAFLASWAPPAH